MSSKATSKQTKSISLYYYKTDLPQCVLVSRIGRKSSQIMSSNLLYTSNFLKDKCIKILWYLYLEGKTSLIAGLSSQPSTGVICTIQSSGKNRLTSTHTFISSTFTSAVLNWNIKKSLWQGKEKYTEKKYTLTSIVCQSVLASNVVRYRRH